MIFPVQQAPTSYINADIHAIILFIGLCVAVAFVGFFIREEAKNIYSHTHHLKI